MAMLAFMSMPAHARPPEIADIFQLREIGGFRSGLVLSPDASHVAVFERETLLDEDDYRFRLVVVLGTKGSNRPPLLCPVFHGGIDRWNLEHDMGQKGRFGQRMNVGGLVVVVGRLGRRR